MKKTINGLQDNEEITAIIRIRKNPDTQHVLTVLTFINHHMDDTR
jgi:hypothetical protein